MAETPQQPLPEKVRVFKVTIAVTVDDATKYDVEMDSLCDRLMKDLRGMLKGYDPVKRSRMEIEKVDG